jgi:hypothetical protein
MPSVPCWRTNPMRKPGRLSLFLFAVSSCASSVTPAPADRGDDGIVEVPDPRDCATAPLFAPGMTIRGDTCAIRNEPGSACLDACDGYVDDQPQPSCDQQSRAFYRVEIPPAGTRLLTIANAVRITFLTTCTPSALQCSDTSEFARTATFPDYRYTFPLENRTSAVRTLWLAMQGGTVCGPFEVSMSANP